MQRVIELSGKFSDVRIFADKVEDSALQQIAHILDQEFVYGSKIRIMPDVHAGFGCVIGTTMTIFDKVVPSLVGVDIGCGIEVVELGCSAIDFLKLDKCIRKKIPSGFNIRDTAHYFTENIDIDYLYCAKHIDKQRALLSVGTLGGGNHFIEIDEDVDGNMFLLVHSGSRYLGKQIAEYYQNASADELSSIESDRKQLIAELKQQGRESEIASELKKLKPRQVDRVLAYASGELFKRYIHDMDLAQKYADWNRKAIVKEILREMDWPIRGSFTTVHNYIDMNRMILRKGAVSAESGEKLVIPMNMRDGSLLCMGKGNEDWNYSAPHGAGRIMSRKVARESLTLTKFKEEMHGIYTSSISRDTIDESPMAYKSMSDIVSKVEDTVDILGVIKSVYNYKAGGE